MGHKPKYPQFRGAPHNTCIMWLYVYYGSSVFLYKSKTNFPKENLDFFLYFLIFFFFFFFFTLKKVEFCTKNPNISYQNRKKNLARLASQNKTQNTNKKHIMHFFLF